MKETSFLVVAIMLFPLSAFGHGGRLDASGGHHDRKNGGYHYHISRNDPDEGNKPPKMEPRKEARDEPKIEAKSIARTTAKTTARQTGRQSVSNDKMGIMTDFDQQNPEWEKPKPPEPIGPLLLFEVAVDSNPTPARHEFIAMRFGHEGELFRDNIPSPAELGIAIGSLGILDANIRVYLNGMKHASPAWAKSEIESGKPSVWTRYVTNDEYSENSILKLHPLRHWKDNSGKFSREARFHSRTGNQVRLFGVNGRRLTIEVDDLSKEDLEYLQTRRD